MLKKKQFFLFIFLAANLVFNVHAQNSQGILGVWQVNRIVTAVGNQTYENSDPLPGLMIFTSGFYSMVWMPGGKPVPDNVRIWHPSDQEKVAQFNAIIVNSGKYVVQDSLLITEPIVAKTPEFIGGKASYVWTMMNDILLLRTQETYSRDGILDEGVQKYRTAIYLKRME